MAKIQESRDYDKFLLHKFNRDVKKTDMLENSMLRHGWIDAYPMHVIPLGKDYIIKGGHHRFTVAKKLNLPVKFVVCSNDDVTIHELEKSTNRWEMDDYLSSYAGMGLHDYQYVKKYQKRTGFPIGICISVCAGESANSGNHRDRFKNGTYKLGKQDRAEKLALISENLKKIGIEFHTNSNLLKALSKCLFVDQFDENIFIKKVKSNKQIFEKQPGIERYLEMIDTVYNRGTKKTQVIPLAHLANIEANKRNVKYKNGRI